MTLAALLTLSWAVVAHASPSIDAGRQCAEADFLRACADLGLAHALDDLDRLEPAQGTGDPATEHLRGIARARLDLRSADSTTTERARAIADLRRLGGELAQKFRTDPRRAIWLADAAEDELVLGFLIAEPGPQAIAGRFSDEVHASALAALKRTRDLLDDADAASAGRAASAEPEFAGRIADDDSVRRPLLRAIATALEAAIDRTSAARASEDERAARAALVSQIQRLRERAPARLRIEADLGEAAAAAVVPDAAAAQFAAARVALAGDAVAFALARIFAIDALVAERRPQEALAQLQPLLASEGLPASLALLCADAAVRTRVSLGKSMASDATLAPWIDALRRASRSDRGWVRDAVLDRLSFALDGVRVESELSVIAEIARARTRAAREGAEGAAARAYLTMRGADRTDKEAQACALLSLAWGYAHANEPGDAAHALARAAAVLVEEPAGARAMSAAVAIELALDDEIPDARRDARDHALALARTNYPELPERPRIVLAQEATMARELLDKVIAQLPHAHDPAHTARIAQHAINLQAGLAREPDDAPVVARARATLEACETSMDIAGAGKTPEPASSATAWLQFTSQDAARLARLRLERAALRCTNNEDRRTACAAIPSSAASALDAFLAASTAPTNAASTAISPTDTQRVAATALAIALAWENAHNAPPTTTQRRLRCRAATLASDWPAALREARLMAVEGGDARENLAVRCTALRGAIHADAAHRASPESLQELMQCGRALATASEPQSPEWWLAQTAQLEAASLSGRGGEPVRAKIARLRSLDATLGGAPSHAAITALDRVAP